MTTVVVAGVVVVPPELPLGLLPPVVPVGLLAVVVVDVIDKFNCVLAPTVKIAVIPVSIPLT